MIVTVKMTDSVIGVFNIIYKEKKYCKEQQWRYTCQADNNDTIALFKNSRGYNDIDSVQVGYHIFDSTVVSLAISAWFWI